MARLQIDMLPVGDSDALLVEVEQDGAPVVALIDGGRNWEDGERVLRHLRTYYGGRIDHLILSHIDVEHANTMLHIVESLPDGAIGQAWVQDLSKHGVDAQRAVKLARKAAHDARSSAVRSVADHVADSVETVDRLLSVLKKRGIPVAEAFVDGTNRIGPFEVLGPTAEFFEDCVKFYDKAAMLDAMVDEGIDFRRRTTAATGPAASDEALDSAVDDPQTEKQASLVMLLEYMGDRYLFTGDAGRKGFDSVPDRERMRNLHWLKIPNHGSKHNVDSALLDLFRPALAYISCAGVGIDPHPDLLAALEKRGATVYTTARSGDVWHRRGDVPPRTGFGTHKPA